MNRAIISYGSNIDPKNNVQKWINIVNKQQNLLSSTKPIWTKPRGYTKQPDFLNGVVYIETKMNRLDLNKWLKSIEKKLGRIKTSIKAGPRTIDLDIIVWNNKIVNDDFENYDFVKKSVLEILPDLPR